METTVDEKSAKKIVAAYKVLIDVLMKEGLMRDESMYNLIMPNFICDSCLHVSEDNAYGSYRPFGGAACCPRCGMELSV